MIGVRQGRGVATRGRHARTWRRVTYKGWRYAVLLLLGTPSAHGDERTTGDPVIRAEADRIDMVARVSPSVVCVYDRNQRGGGSGVIIDPSGYGLTNYHVVAEMLDTREGWGGLSDGKLYDLEVLGIDPTGDVAMFRLVGDRPFVASPLGDSSVLRVGDAVVAMGNPFTVSEDYTPSVSLGIVSGVHRYQSGVGKNLVYSDCLQFDAAINPGNSGGPLYNLSGEVVGINGRISVKGSRGKLNVGFGYAIPMHQIRRFIPALRAGLLGKHGTLPATVDPDPAGGLRIQRLDEDSNAFRSGLRRGDRLLRLDGVPMSTTNQFVGQLGTYPADWPVPLFIERDGRQSELVVRLEPVTPKSQRPFMPDGQVGARQIEYVLRKYQSATMPAGTGNRPRSWKWKVRRHHSPDSQNAEGHREEYMVSQTGDGPMRWQRRYEDGSSGPTYTANQRQVVQHLPNDDTPLEPALETQLTFCALYVWQRWLLEPVESVDLSFVLHGGADRFLPVDRSAEGEERILEVLDWALTEQTRARFSFDRESGQMVGIRVRDKTTDAEVTVRVTDSGETNGWTLPRRLTVSAKGRSYTDEFLDWEIAP